MKQKIIKISWLMCSPAWTRGTSYFSCRSVGGRRRPVAIYGWARPKRFLNSTPDKRHARHGLIYLNDRDGLINRKVSWGRAEAEAAASRRAASSITRCVTPASCPRSRGPICNAMQSALLTVCTELQSRRESGNPLGPFGNSRHQTTPPIFQFPASTPLLSIRVIAFGPHSPAASPPASAVILVAGTRTDTLSPLAAMACVSTPPFDST